MRKLSREIKIAYKLIIKTRIMIKLKTKILKIKANNKFKRKSSQN